MNLLSTVQQYANPRALSLPHTRRRGMASAFRATIAVLAVGFLACSTPQKSNETGPSFEEVTPSDNGLTQLRLSFSNLPMSANAASSNLPELSHIELEITGENIPADAPITSAFSMSSIEAYYEVFLPQGRNQIARASAIAPDGSIIKTISGVFTTEAATSVTAQLNIFTTPVAEAVALSSPGVQAELAVGAIQEAVFRIIGFDAALGTYLARPSLIDIPILAEAVRLAVEAAGAASTITADDILGFVAAGILPPLQGGVGFDIDFGIPVVTMTADVASGFAPLTVNFAAVATGFGGTIIQFKWDIDGDGIFDSIEAEPTFLFEEPGVYTVRVQVQDNAGTVAETTLGVEAVRKINARGRVAGFQEISATAGNFGVPALAGDLLGAVAPLGDFDGDGIEDLIIGAQRTDGAGVDRGAVHIVFLASDGSVKDYATIDDSSLGLADALVDGSRFGVDVASLGDLDGDGVGDILVGAVGSDNLRGAAYVIFLNSDATVKSFKRIDAASIATLRAVDLFGFSVESLGDLNDDGVTDVAIGAHFDDGGLSNTGAVYVVFLGTDGTVRDYQKISRTAGDFRENLDAEDRFGVSVGAVGDLDSDGVTEIIVGAYLDDDARNSAGNVDRGAAYILFLNRDGTVKASQKLSDTQGNTFALLDDNDLFGVAVDGLGDIDGDAIPDVAIGAYRDDDGGGDRGAVYIVFLNADGTAKRTRKISDTEGRFAGSLEDGDNFGRWVAGLPDINGDRVPDLAVGSFGADRGGVADAGAAYVLFLE